MFCVASRVNLRAAHRRRRAWGEQSIKAARALGPVTENISEAPQPCRAPQQHLVCGHVSRCSQHIWIWASWSYSASGRHISREPQGQAERSQSTVNYEALGCTRRMAEGVFQERELLPGKTHPSAHLAAHMHWPGRCAGHSGS